MEFAYGRRPAYPATTHPRIPLSTILASPLPPVPAVVDRSNKIGAWPLFLNDRLGDCVEAGAGHAEQVWSTYGNGTTVTVSNADIIAFYSAAAGYVPGDPSTDNGTVIQDALGVWSKTGLAGHKIAAFAEIDIHNFTEITAAVYFFGTVMLGVKVPRSAEQQFQAGQTWDVVANDGGIVGLHCIIVTGFDTNTGLYTVITWGRRQKATRAWLLAYMDEAWVPLSLEWQSAAGVDTDGLDGAALNNAYQQVTGRPGPFPVTPGPVTPPGPDPVAAAHALAAALRSHGWVNAGHSGPAAAVAKAGAAWLAATGL